MRNARRLGLLQLGTHDQVGAFYGSPAESSCVAVCDDALTDSGTHLARFLKSWRSVCGIAGAAWVGPGQRLT